MQIEIFNRWTGRLQFTAEIACDDSAPIGIKIGLAVKWARKSDAVLSGADLSDAVLSGADLRGADLRGAVLRGADLRGAVLRGAVLRDAVLRDAVLRDAVLSGADLSGAVLRGAVLRGADLRGAVLRGADLRDAVLSGADLSGAVLRGAEVPIIENIDSKILAAIEAGGTLKMYDWHTCDTSHCRAGWAIHLAGEAGFALEAKVGSAAAGALIYAKSAPGKPIPDFYASDDAALADIKRRAAEETAA